MMTAESICARDAIVGLRGPAGGYAHTHAGLAAFWRHVERDILVCPLAPEDEAQFLALDTWLVSGTRRALFMGEDEARRTALLARWALSVAERAAAVVFFVPVSPSFGTAIQREIQKLLFGLYATTGSMWRCNACTPIELKSAIAMGLRFVQYAIPPSGIERDGDTDMEHEGAADPVVLLVVDGLERTADLMALKVLTERVLCLDETGDTVRILVSVGAPGASEDASTWRKRQCWAEEDTTVFELPAAPAPGEEAVTKARRALEAEGENGRLAARTIDALSAVLAPVSQEDLTVSLGVPLAALQALEVAPRAARSLVVVEPEGTLHLCDDAVRVRWGASVDTGAIEDDLIARGLSALAAEKAPEGGCTWPGYLVEYLGAHMVRRRATCADLMQLVSPAWLTAWMNRPGAVVGFVTDAYRARLAAEDALFQATTEFERRAPLHDLVWCAVVTESLLAKEGSRREERDTTLPYREPTVDLARPTGVERDRAETLATLAGLLSGPEHDQVIAWVEEVRAMLGEGPDREPRPVPEVKWEPATSAQVDPEIARRLRTKGEYWKDTVPIVYYPRAACLILGPEETLARARTEKDGPLYARIAPHLPDPLRRQVVAEAVASFGLTHPDKEDLPLLFACAPWMSDEDASWLLCAVIGSDPENDLFAGPRGLTDLAPLLLKLGGSAAIFDAASTLVTVGRWLP